MKKIKYLNIDTDVNVYVVGDIHSCYSLLMEKLKGINFDFKHDLLISVGDIIDRGKENEKCIGLINETWFTSIRGNHEDFCVKGAHNPTIEYVHKAPNNGGSWFYDLPDDIRYRVADIFDSLPLMLEVNYLGKKFGFVHADIPYGDWELTKDALTQGVSIRGRGVDEYLMWSRNLINMCLTEAYQPIIDNIDHVFFGHTVLPKVSTFGNCTFLDTGAVFKQKGQPYDLSIIKLSDYIN